MGRVVRVGAVAIDGTKVAASASMRANRSYAALGEEEENGTHPTRIPEARRLAKLRFEPAPVG